MDVAERRALQRRERDGIKRLHDEEHTVTLKASKKVRTREQLYRALSAGMRAAAERRDDVFVVMDLGGVTRTGREEYVQAHALGCFLTLESAALYVRALKTYDPKHADLQQREGDRYTWESKETGETRVVIMRTTLHGVVK